MRGATILVSLVALACHANPGSGPLDTGGDDLTPASMHPRRVFVLDRQSGTVKAFDAETFAQLGEVPVGTRPTELALSSDQTTLVVTVTGSAPGGPADGSVAILDVQAGGLSVASVLAVGSAPWGVVLSLDGSTAWVSDAGAASVYAIDLATHQVQTLTDPVLDTPQGMDLSPDGNRLYVANVAFLNSGLGLPVGPENVTVIETASRSVVDFIDLSSVVSEFGPWDVTVLPNGASIFTNDGDNGRSLFGIDPATHTVTVQVALGPGPSSFGVGPRGLDSGVSMEGTRVFAALMESDEVVAVDPATGAIVNRVTIPQPWRVRLNPEGSQLWVSSRSSGSVRVLDPASLQTLAVIGGFAQPADIAFEMPPRTPEERIDGIRDVVLELEATGILGGGEAQALLSKVDAAASQLAKGNAAAAANIVRAFVHHVEALRDSGRLSGAEAEVLIAAASELIEQVEGAA